MYSQASQITFICPMIFNYFPLDTQVCKFQVGSYSYNMEKMIFAVTQLGYAHTSRSIVLDYDITINKLREADRIFVGGSLGNYSLAGFEMILRRHVSHYIINYYLPSGLFVVVSWISFLVPADIIPGRMALLVTLFLVLVNIFNTVTTNTPKAEGLTAIEAWMLSCILFVFATLIEYACLLFAKEPQEMPEINDLRSPESVNCTTTNIVDSNNGLEMHETGSTTGKNDPQHHPGSGPEELTGLTEHLRRHTVQQGDSGFEQSHLHNHPGGVGRRSPPIVLRQQTAAQKQRARHAKIDRFFLVFFPVLFLIFNIVYWLAYYYAHPPMEIQAEQREA